MPALFVIFMLVVSSTTLFAQTTNNLAPGAPGHDAHWESASKEGIGTSASIESKVWFTLNDGVMTEVYYPTVDVANVRMLQFIIVSDGGRQVETEAEDTTHAITVDGTGDTPLLSFRQTNIAKSGRYRIVKFYTIDPERHSIMISVGFESLHKNPDYQLYLYYDPSLNNSGMHDAAWSQGGALLASDADKASAVVTSVRLSEIMNGYFGTSDGLLQLRNSAEIIRKDPMVTNSNIGTTIKERREQESSVRAADGNVVQVARVQLDPWTEKQSTRSRHFTLALGFGREADEALQNARTTLKKGFSVCDAQYREGWQEYVQSLRRVERKYQEQFNMAAMILKAHEDKTYRGAMVASLSVPWGGGANANEPNISGYHTVWSRDLYQVATAFQAMGDKPAADRALNYLFTIQQKPDGSFPQNSWLDGRPAGGGLQMDEVAYPLILAYQLGRTDNETWVKHVKPAADFLVRKGPATPQERWEEEAGYSPSTIAAEIAGLVCAAEIARRNGDEQSSKTYLTTADEWASKVNRWTATTTGTYGDKNYYIRISDDEDPNDGARLEINSNGGTYDEREIVDAGFLELVRLGIKRADDPLITKSLAVVDKVIQIETPNGAAWYRYNHDAYGERADGGRYDARTGRGRLWTLLTGERGQYELALGERERARTRLDAMMKFSNRGQMIPEQIWDSSVSPSPVFIFGEGTGSATPLAWSMAQFIRLVVNLEEGRNLDTPDVVADRYIKRRSILKR